MTAGTVIAARFELKAVAGSGGMGRVFRALDKASGRLVAVKLQGAASGALAPALASEARARNEAEILAELPQPGIVGYVASGFLFTVPTEAASPASRPQKICWLAMEWIDGESLAARLKRAPLSIKECVLLLRRMASALAVIHERGIVHCDIKPANILLRDGQIEQATLIDFGIARRWRAPDKPGAALSSDESGKILGTPEYTAPELVRGERGVGPAADIFSLGCVIYECLTGRQPFAAHSATAALAKVLLETPPLGELCKGMPAPLATLISRMLEKDKANRLPDGAALVKELAALEPVLVRARTSGAFWIPGEPLTLSAEEAEQHLFCVVLAQAPPALDGASGMASEIHELRTFLIGELARHGAKVEWLPRELLLLTCTGESSAISQALRAASCALLVQQIWPEAVVVMATGRAVRVGQVPTGEAIDRAAQLLDARLGQWAAARAGKNADPGPRRVPRASGVWLDNLSARLLHRQLNVTETPDGFVLQDDVHRKDRTEPLLGKPTPCVGREQELSFLRSMLLECIRTPRSTGVLVLGPAGIGKSRLRREFVRRWQAQPEPEVSVEVDVIIGQADPRSHHVPYQLIRSVLRRLCLIHGNEPLDAQQLRLRRRLGQHLHVDSAERILEQLAELCGVRMPHSDFGVLESIQPVEGLSQAFISFLRAESAVHPQLWIIEEMQWADRQSIALFDEALRALGDRPLFLLALGQHESRELLPSPRCERWQELPLSGLSNKASERILRGVLSGPLDDDLISRLTTLASGNALFLEEMARTVAGGKPEVIPETVLAMLQARLFLLSAESRRVLRLASVCGESFRRSELLALLAPDIDEKSLSFSLQELLVAELIERTSEGEGEAEEEGQFRFHHWLLKDAAYSLLSAEERIRAHCLLSQHLESVGGAPAHLRQAILALQSQEDSAKNRRRRAELLVELVRVTRGQEPIEQNLSRLSQAEALLEAAKSPETAAQDELLGMHISYWLGILRIDSNERQDAIRLFESLISRSYEIHRRDGSEEPRLMLIGSMLGRIYTLQGQVGRAVWLLEKLRPLLGTDPHELDLQLLISMGFLGLALGMSGAWRRGLQICERVLEMAQAHGDPLRVSAASALLGLLFIMAGQPQRSVQIIAPGIAAAERSGSLLYLHSCCTTSAWAHSRIGEHATAQEQLALAARFGQKLGPRPQLLDWCAMIRAELAFLRGDLDAARKLCDDALRIARQCGGSFTAGIAHRILAQSLCGMDPAGFPEATRHLQSSLESLRFGQAMIEAARTEAVWGSLCLRHGQMEEAQRRLKSALAAFSKLDLQTEHDVVAAQLASLGC